MDDVISYKCPNCSAPISFDIDAQKWECKFCLASFDPQEVVAVEEQTGSRVEDATFPEFADSGEQYSEQETVAYSCPSCGGRVLTDKNTAATFCIYCHNPTVIASRLEGEHQPEYIIPFKHKKEQAIEALKKLCMKKPLLPKEFRDYVNNGEVSGLYVPFWLFDSNVSTQMTAQGTKVTSWRSGDYRYTKTDTYDVRRSAEMRMEKLPADGSARMDDALMESLEPYNYSDLTQFSMHYLSGHYAESFDVSADEVSRRAMNRIRSGADRLTREQAKGYTSLHVQSMNIQTSGESRSYAMLPVWTVMTKYKGKDYIFAMNGQTGKITGRLPLSWKRFWALAGMVFAACIIVSVLLALGGRL